MQILGSGNAPPTKCYGTLDTYNAMSNIASFYYDYEYSAFSGGFNGIACETPVFNTDVISFFGRSRNWGNNGACDTLYGCPTPSAGSETIYAMWTADASNFLSQLIMEACPWNGAQYWCSGAGLPARVTNTSCDGAVTGVDWTYHVSQALLENVSNCSDAGVDRTCTFYVGIYGPSYYAGLYGDDVPMISGYRIYVTHSPLCCPSSGSVAGWTATDTYIPYAGDLSLGSFTYTWPNSDQFFISYIPIFNNRAGTDIVTLEANGMAPTGFVAPFGGHDPTPVTFESFTAHYADLQTVALEWVTASENDAMGFNLYRSLDALNWTKVNPTLIQAMGQGGGGAAYAYTDNLPRQRTYQAWRYKVEELNNGGQRTTEAATEVAR